MNNKAIHLATLGSTLSALILAGCQKPAVQPPDIRPVRVMAVSAGPIDGALEYSAEIRPRIESRLGFRVGGKMISRQVDVGAVVKVGQVLATLDAGDLELGRQAAAAQLSGARVNHDLAAADLRRYTDLRDKGFISQSELDRRKTSLDAAKAQLDTAEAQAKVQGNQAGYAVLTADLNGVVTAVDAEAGQVVSAGQSIVRVARAGDVEAAFSIPENQIAALRAARDIEVRTWSRPERPLRARVREIAPLADPATRTFPVRATLLAPPPDVLLGMTATARLLGNAGPARITVPLTAVVRPAGAAGAAAGKGAVWVLDPQAGTVKQVEIATGATQGNSIVVESGLTSGQLVVTAGVHTLQPGQKVVRLPEGGIGSVPESPR